MARPIRFTYGNLAAASVNNIATSQSVASGAAFNLNGSAVVGGVAVLDQARRVLITSAGNDSAVTFTVTGTNRQGQVITESLLGGNIAAVNTYNDFLTVTSVTVSPGTASTVQLGTTTIASTLIPLDWYANPTNISINAVVTGTINFTVNETWDDAYPANGLTPANFVAIAALTGKTSTTQTTITSTATELQLVINSGSGSVFFELVQARWST